MAIKKEVEKITITKGTGEEVVSTEIMAQAIVDISAAMKKIAGSRLNRRAIIVLIHDSIPYSKQISKADIEMVLDHAEGLAKKFLK